MSEFNIDKGVRRSPKVKPWIKRRGTFEQNLAMFLFPLCLAGVIIACVVMYRWLDAITGG